MENRGIPILLHRSPLPIGDSCRASFTSVHVSEHKIENTQFQRATIFDPVYEEPYTAHLEKKAVGWRGWIPQLPEVECAAKTKKELLDTLAIRLREALQAREDAWDKQFEADIEAGKLEHLQLVEAYTHRGNAYRAKAELDSAIADYTEALKLRPKVAESYYTRGEAWLLAKEWEGAKTDLTAAILQGVDVAAAFHNTYGSIATFEQKIGIRLPKEIVELLTPRSGSPFEIERDARIALGMKYYGNGELSSGLAARLAGVPRVEFIFLMGDYGLSPFGPDEEAYAKSGF